MQINDAVKSIETLVGSLNTLKSSLNNTINSTKNNRLRDNVDNSVKTINTLKKAMNFGIVYAGIRKGWNVAKNISNEYIDMIETNNLFEVSMGKVVDQYGNLDTAQSKYYIKAMKFQDEMNEKLATNKVELMNYQAMYYSMFNSQLGSKNKDKSYFVSENLTKAGYDIASLYNLTVDQAMSKIKSGIAGQVEPLRTIGIDISESALQKVLNEVGITNRSVQQLSYAEKEVARYIAIIDQAKQAQGDFAKTFEQPANQIKVLTNQWAELKQVAGYFVVNVFGGMLTYVNAIIMVVKEILKGFAGLFGYDLTTGGADLSTAVGVEDLNSGLGSAGKKAKELKKQLMGFDEINNIDPASKTSGGAGKGAVTGIDDKLLNSLKEWDNKMSSISGKAQEIRDAILDWLGLSDGIPKTFEEWWNKLGKIQKILLVITGIISGIYVIGKITKLISWLKNLFAILKTGKGAVTTFGLGLQTIGKIINTTKSGYTNLKTWISMVIEQYKMFRSQGNGVIESLKLTNKQLSTTNQGFLSLIPTWAKVAGGIIGLVGSSTLAYKSMEDLSNGSINATEGLLKLTGGLTGATASGALLGSAIPGVGTAIGALAGFVIGATSAFVGYKTETVLATQNIENATNKTNDYIKAIKKEKETIQEKINSGLAEQEHYKKIVNELETLVDTNGKVKAGYSDRVSFILNQLNEAYGTEYRIVDGTIQKYDELKKNIYKIIEAEKAKIILNANEETYANAIKRQVENQTKLREQIQEQNKAQQAYNNKLNELKDKYGDVQKARELAHKAPILPKDFKDFEELEKALDKSKNKVNELSKSISNDNKTIIYWEDLKEATVTGDNKKIQESMKNLTTTYTTETGNQEKTLLDQINAEINMTNDRKRIWEENGIEINETRKLQLETGIRTLAEKLLEQTTTVENLTEDQVQAWKTLAINAEEAYNEQILQLDEDTRLILDTLTQKIDISSPECSEKWRNLASQSSEKYNQALIRLPEDTRNKIQEIVGATYSKQGDINSSFSSLATGAINAFGQINGYNSGANLVSGIEKGVKDNKYKITQALTGVANGAVRAFNATLGIHSPSRVMMNYSKFIPIGIAKGIENESNTVFNSMKELSEGIKVNTKDIAIDTNQYVDYGKISGQVQAQSNISMNSNIVQGIAEAVKESIRNAEVNVNIEAKADEGIIVKKASQGFKDYVMQTGELPFPVPV